MIVETLGYRLSRAAYVVVVPAGLGAFADLAPEPRQAAHNQPASAANRDEAQRQQRPEHPTEPRGAPASD